MIYILGIITGLVIAVLVLLILSRNKPAINRTINQLQNKLKKKGSVIELESEEVDDWIRTLPNNENTETQES